MTFAANPGGLRILYVREVPKDKDVKYSVACREWGVLKGSGPIEDVMFSLEQVRLYVSKTADAPGRIELVVDDEIQKTIDQNVKSGGVTVLSGDRLVTALRRQGRLAHWVVPDALELYDNDLKGVGLEGMKVETVK